MNQTLLMNSTRRQYMRIGSDFPKKIGTYLLSLEATCGWDLRLDCIYVSHSSSTYGYQDIRDLIIKKEISKGGEVIPETFDLYDLM